MIEKYLNRVHCSDCLTLLKELPDNCVDAIVTDPPAGISFMGKDWDSNKGGRDEWIKWMQSVMSECLRVLKSGGHAFIWAIPRTSHWTATAVENAGFEIRDIVTHHFGSGFPKSLNISKAIDKKFGAEREIVGKKPYTNDRGIKSNKFAGGHYERIQCYETASSTPEAKQYDGWGTALKPASEHWILARKPLSEKTVADNVLKHGTGGINIDACRINVNRDIERQFDKENYSGKKGSSVTGKTRFLTGDIITKRNDNWLNKGRFPSNVILSHHPECKEIGVKEVKGISGGNSRAIQKNCYNDYGKNYENKPDKKKCGFADKNGKETVPHYECHPDCPVKMLDKQSGVSKSCGGSGNKSIQNANPFFQTKLNKAGANLGGLGDTGTASRFFYCAKPSRAERNKGCDNLEEKIAGGMQCRNDGSLDGKIVKSKNHHPTVKPKKLMEYLIKMITPKGGIVLDCFAGSGSSLVACERLGRRWIGVEKEPDYCRIANERIKAEQAQGKLPL